MEICIEANSISKKFGTKSVLQEVSFYVMKGEVFGLLGQNGAGKSTTIDCLLGLKKVNEGSVKILGQNPKKKRKQLYERVGVQLQSSSYQANIRVEEICEETAALYKESMDYNQLLKKFGMYDLKKQPVDKLSGGEKQKLSVVLALIPKPEIIFLDELTTGLDVLARRQVWQTLKELKKNNLTILLTSHYMDEVEELCDRVCILNKGKVVAIGTVNELMTNSSCDNLEEAYLWYVREERSA